MDNQSFFASKTMQLISLSIAAILVLVTIGVVMQAAFGVNVFDVIVAGIGGITGQSGLGTYRNVTTDAPIRQSIASQQQQKPAIDFPAPLNTTFPSDQRGE